MIEQPLHEALQAARDVSDSQPSRELSLTITKLEEADHWLQALKERVARLEAMTAAQEGN